MTVLRGVDSLSGTRHSYNDIERHIERGWPDTVVTSRRRRYEPHMKPPLNGLLLV